MAKSAMFERNRMEDVGRLKYSSFDADLLFTVPFTVSYPVVLSIRCLVFSFFVSLVDEKRVKKEGRG